MGFFSRLLAMSSALSPSRKRASASSAAPLGSETTPARCCGSSCAGGATRRAAAPARRGCPGRWLEAAWEAAWLLGSWEKARAAFLRVPVRVGRS
jgi:hypothetical protein